VSWFRRRSPRLGAGADTAVIAASVYLGPLLPGYLVTTVQYPHTGMAWWEVGPPLVLVTVTGALLVASAARTQHLSRL
jgi:hypothetical protein